MGIEPVDEVTERGRERRIVVVGVLADEGDDLSVVVGSLAAIAPGLADHAEPVVAVMGVREAREEIVRGLLGRVELAGLDEVDHGVGSLGQFVEAVIGVQEGLEEAWPAGGCCRCLGSLIGSRGAGGRRVLREAALLVLLATAAGARIIPSDLGHSILVGRTTPLYQALLSDARFHEQLLAFDRDIAADAKSAGCPRCGGSLHWARFARKSRGAPAGLGEDYNQRFSFCCAASECRKRRTPASLRFLGRRVYLATVVTLVSALQHGVTANREQRLSVALGIDRRTLARWRAWWLATFAGPFRPIAMAAFMPPLDLDLVPDALLDRFGGDAAAKLVSLLRFLGPLTGGTPAHAF